MPPRQDRSRLAQQRIGKEDVTVFIRLNAPGPAAIARRIIGKFTGAAPAAGCKKPLKTTEW